MWCLSHVPETNGCIFDRSSSAFVRILQAELRLSICDCTSWIVCVATGAIACMVGFDTSACTALTMPAQTTFSLSHDARRLEDSPMTLLRLDTFVVLLGIDSLSELDAFARLASTSVSDIARYLPVNRRPAQCKYPRERNRWVRAILVPCPNVL